MKAVIFIKTLVTAAVLTVSSTSSFAGVVSPSLSFTGGSASFGSPVSGKFSDSFGVGLGTASSAGFLNGSALSVASNALSAPGGSLAAPATEPKTSTMLLAGLGVMVAIARRRMKTTV